jgi:Aspartate/ornithine carbamoyltransferase, carbamoyl-P binding domain
MRSHTASTHPHAGPLGVPGLRLDDAMALMQDTPARQGTPPPKGRVLEGRHVAIVCASEHEPSAAVFIGAAQALGARIARISPADLELDHQARAADTARLLGRLYAAIGCAGLDPASVALLRHTCGVPVLHDLAAQAHASRLLADVMTLKQVLRDRAAPLPSRPRLGVLGPARSTLMRAWKQVAGASGIEVIELSRPGADAGAAGCHFVCRPGEPPELLAVEAGGLPASVPGPSLAERQRINHGLVVQAMLRNEVGSRA